MHPIIYIEGRIADAVGAVHVQKLADEAARLAREPITVLTWGPSEYHDGKRFVGKVETDR